MTNAITNLDGFGSVTGVPKLPQGFRDVFRSYRVEANGIDLHAVIERIERIALGEAIVPGLSPSPPLLSDDRWTSDFLWHFNFNRALGVNERLVEGREDLYFGYQFDTKAGSVAAFPAYGKEFYIETLRRVPGALKASFDYYRAIDESIPQYRRRKTTKIEVPVLAFAGALACGDMVANELRSVALNVESAVIPDCGHYPAEEQPAALLDALQRFLRLPSSS